MVGHIFFLAPSAGPWIDGLRERRAIAGHPNRGAFAANNTRLEVRSPDYAYGSIPSANYRRHYLDTVLALQLIDNMAPRMGIKLPPTHPERMETNKRRQRSYVGCASFTAADSSFSAP
jgi:hypothetical protein